MSPGHSSLTDPVRLQRSESVFISSHLELNCTDTLKVTTKWKIVSCKSACSDEVSFDQLLVNTSHSDLYIPGRTLPYGIYKLILTTSMADARSLDSSDHVYVEITQSNIVANLVWFGTSMITIDGNQNLTLDPGHFSIDPDEIKFNANVSHHPPHLSSNDKIISL